MVNRRELLRAGVGLPVAIMAGSRADAAAAQRLDRAGRDPRSSLAALTGSGSGSRERLKSGCSQLLTGVEAIDSVTGGIAVGGLTCLLGRAAMGKTKLAMQIALSVVQRHQCNVLVSSAREPAWMIAAQRCVLPANVVVVGNGARLNWAVHVAKSSPPAVYIIDIDDVVVEEAWSVVDWLAAGIRHCGLWIADGWSSYPVSQSQRAVRIDERFGHVPVDASHPPVELTAQALSVLKNRAESLGIPVIAGIRIADTNEGNSCRQPWASDLGYLEIAVSEIVDRQVWMHRPHVYTKNLPGNPFTVELSSALPFLPEVVWRMGRRA